MSPVRAPPWAKGCLFSAYLSCAVYIGSIMEDGRRGTEPCVRLLDNTVQGVGVSQEWECIPVHTNAHYHVGLKHGCRQEGPLCRREQFPAEIAVQLNQVKKGLHFS